MTHTRRSILSAALVVVGSLAGCTVNHTRGVVAMKIDERTAHVCVRRAETRVGDRMGLYRNDCTHRPRTRPNCELKLAGEGTITELINEHYALLVFDKPTDFHEGDLIEKVDR